MARKREDSGGPGQGWLVTFSDCMTLLLCFFVMLLSFSSFDAAARSRMGGAFRNETFDSIFSRRVTRDNIIEQESRAVDHTEHGSIHRTDARPKRVDQPRDLRPKDNYDAYSSRRVLRIPSDELFHPDTALWRQGGRKSKLGLIAKFLDHLPCEVVVGESRGHSPGGGAELSIRRARAVIGHLVGQLGVPAKRVSLRASETGAAGRRFDGRPVVEIALLKLDTPPQ